MSLLRRMLTYVSSHDSASVRKAHNIGRNHLQKVRDYYQNIGHEKAQSVIDLVNQDYQMNALESMNSLFAQANPMLQHSSFTMINGILYGGPKPGMPLQPPPNMPLPGGGCSPAPAPLKPTPFPFQVQQGSNAITSALGPPAGPPVPPISGAGGRMEG